MSFNGNEGEFVSLTDASRWTANYRNTIQPGEVISLFGGKEKIQELLNQEGSIGLRMYFSIDDAGNKNVVFVAVDSNGNDNETGLLLDKWIPCPPSCPKKNSLNS